MNPVDVHRQVTGAYRRYLRSSQRIKNPTIEAWVEERVQSGQFLWRSPLVTVRRRFEAGETLEGLVEDGLLDPVVLKAFSAKVGNPGAGPIAPYRHQTDAIRLLCGDDPKNVVVATGTGSGKSFTFSIPIVSTAKRARDEGIAGVKAVIVYPMNALANSQYEELAARLHGTGLTVANYTGDLRHTRERALERFAVETGRDQPWDSEVICRDDVQQHGVDLLITNYVMLELILTRWDERNVFPFDQLGSLRYLVLDEVHTYTGRQGADVACLIRRLKEHTGSKETLRCIGTSATVDSDAGEAAGRATIASFTAELFGSTFEPESVITERYADPLTTRPDGIVPTPLAADEGLLNAVASGAEGAPDAARRALSGLEDPTTNDLAAHGGIAYLEHECAGRIRTWDDVIADYREHHRPTATEADAALELELAMVVGNATTMDVNGTDVPLIIPKVHTFVSQGRPITSTLRGQLSDRGEASFRTEQGDEIPAFPILFCNACGMEALSATRSDQLAGETFSPSDFNSLEVNGEPGYLFFGAWDRTSAPPDDSKVKQDGTARKGWAGAVPVDKLLDGNGELADKSGTPMCWVPRPLLLCPACGVQYSRGQGEFQKFFQPGMVGRATATNVLLGEILPRLPMEAGKQKQSIIAFADNRQDTAFQAAHANDYQRRVHFRRALATALHDLGAVDDSAKAAPLPSLGGHVYTVMERAGAVPVFSRNPDVMIGPAAGATLQHYKRYLRFGALSELIGRTRWRNNQTLHDVAAIDIVYSGLTELAHDTEKWALVPEMASSGPALRSDTVRGILDTFRIATAVDAEPLNKGDDFREDVVGRLAPTALFHDPSLPPPRPTVLTDDMPHSERNFDVRRLTFHKDAPRDQGLVRWVRQIHPSLMDRDDAKRFIHAVVEVLAEDKIILRRCVGKDWTYRLHENALLVVARTSSVGRQCPKCRTRWEFEQDRPCPRCGNANLPTVAFDWASDYMRREYLTPIGERPMLVVEEHSAQVPGDERKSIETRFRDVDGDLNTLICTPTMELGIDIGGLSAVFLRNVPPSPANYAQRQGRSGRHGQPAYVATFCGTAGKLASHDQYFFRFPDRIVAGRVSPPRFLLKNEDLLSSHLNALTLEYLDFRIPNEPEHFIDFGGDDVPFLADVVTEVKLKLKSRKSLMLGHAMSALGPELAAVGRDVPWVEGRIQSFADRFRDAWRPLIDEYLVLREEAQVIAKRQEAGDLSVESKLRRDSILARLQDVRRGRGDFSPYRYLGNQGFLPNYAFPRRASSVFFADRKESITRHRVIALREFAPEASIYYRGSRYRVERAQPRTRGGGTNWNRIKRCSCGWFTTGENVAIAAVCTSCGKDLEAHFTDRYALELPDMVARPRGRISSDEEERSRRGFVIEPSYRLDSGSPTGELRDSDDAVVGRVTYGPRARLLVTNRGPRGEGDPEGFRMCERCRRWILSDVQEHDHVDIDNPKGSCPAGGTAEDIRSGVVLFSEGRHDMVAIDLAVPPGVDANEFSMSVGNALIDGFEVAFSADESEVAGYHLASPSGDGWVRILLYEKEEGGVGLLHHLIDGDAWRRVAVRALELLHVDPVSGLDRPDACARACYDCLLSFYNQFDHRSLDRVLAIPMLRSLAAGSSLDLSGPDLLWEQFIEAAASSAERDILEELRRRGSPPPVDQHFVAQRSNQSKVAEADLVWPGKVLVMVDGDPHNWAHVLRRDESQRTELKSLGWKVVTIDMDDPDPGLSELLERLGILSSTVSISTASTPDAADADSAASIPLPSVDTRPTSEVSPYEGWVPFVDLAAGDAPPGGDSWVAAPDVPLEPGWFAVQSPGNALRPQYERGSLLLLGPIGDDGVDEGATVLVELREQIDPDSGLTQTLRAWWPERDGDAKITGLTLKARPGSNVDLLVVNEPSKATVLGQLLMGIEA